MLHCKLKCVRVGVRDGFVHPTSLRHTVSLKRVTVNDHLGFIQHLSLLTCVIVKVHAGFIQPLTPGQTVH